MVSFQFDNQAIELNESESVLDALLRNGYNIPHGCKSGVCQSCMLVATQGSPPPASQQGLKANKKSKGCFLPCICTPSESNLAVQTDNESQQKYPAKVVGIRDLNTTIFALDLEVSNFLFTPGQFINVWKDATNSRSYSIASGLNDNVIQLHIKRIPNGTFSEWAYANLTLGDTLEISNPLGDCFYTTENSKAPIILAGIGTGLAPLYGILKHALVSQHEGDIHLVCGARNAEELYLIDELRELETNTKQLKVDFVTQEDSNTADIIHEDIYTFIKKQHPSTKHYLSYLCGAPSFVHKLKKQIFLSGANNANIYSDAFVSAGS